MAKNDEKALRCSFCGRPQALVDRLIAGNGVYICNECVRLCMDMIQEDLYDSDGGHAPELDLDAENLPTPMEMKARLDEYIIGQEDAKITLSVAVYNHYKRILYGDSSDV